MTPDMRKALRERGSRIIAKHAIASNADAREDLAHGIADLVESLSPQEAPANPLGSVGLLASWLRVSSEEGFATDEPQYVAVLRARTERWLEQAKGL